MSKRTPPFCPSSRVVLAELPVQVVLAVLGLLLLSWPILQLAGERGAISLFHYVMGVWGGMVLVLVMVGRGIARQPSALSKTEGAPVNSSEQNS